MIWPMAIQMGMTFVLVAGEMDGFLWVPGVACGVFGAFLPSIGTYCCFFGARVLGVAGTGWFLGVSVLYCGGSCLVGTSVWGAGVRFALYVWRLAHAIAGVSPVVIVLIALTSA